jgi:RHS repeat-associated protein
MKHTARRLFNAITVATRAAVAAPIAPMVPMALMALMAVIAQSAALAQTLPPPPVSPAPVVKLEYDAQGNPKRTTVAPAVLNHSTSHDYDRLHRRTQTTDARGKPTRLDYNGREDLVQVTDPRGLVTQYPRNGLGDATGLISPDTGAASHTLDAAGNLKTRLDSRGVLASYSYDALNRLTQVTYTQSGLPSQSFNWAYDQTGPGFSYGIGRLTSTQFPGGSQTYAYDPQGRLLSTTQAVTTTAGTVSKTVSYGYNPGGKLVSITYPSGRVLYIAHSGGQPTGLSLAPNNSASAVPLISSLQLEIEPGQGRASNAKSWLWHLDNGVLAHQRVFDEWGRMVRYPLGGALRDISYDAADRISSYTHRDAATGAATAATAALNQSFGYDPLGRLTSVGTSIGSWTYGYDDNGNRTLLTNTTTNGTVSRLHTVDTASNRLQSVSSPSRSFGHDAAGNTVSDTQVGRNLSSFYSPSGRLERSTVSVGTAWGSTKTTVGYAYNAEGQRVAKLELGSSNCTGPEGGIQECNLNMLVQGAGTAFVYDLEGKLLGEYSLPDGQAKREYVWLQGAPVAIVEGAVSNPAIYYVHTDHLDTPRTVIDRQGRQRWSWVAEPFGNSAPVTNPIGLGDFVLNLRMPGQYWDAQTGLSQNWHRELDHGLGRYTQSDPIGLAGGINTYSYVEGNPVSKVDPTGEFGIGGALGAAGFNFGTQFLTNLYLTDGDWRRALKCVDVGDVLISGALGFIGPSFLSNVLGGKAGPAGLTAAQNRQIYFTKSLPAGFFLKKGSPPLRAGDDCECQGLNLGNLLGAFAH